MPRDVHARPVGIDIVLTKTENRHRHVLIQPMIVTTVFVEADVFRRGRAEKSGWVTSFWLRHGGTAAVAIVLLAIVRGLPTTSPDLALLLPLGLRYPLLLGPDHFLSLLPGVHLGPLEGLIAIEPAIARAKSDQTVASAFGAVSLASTTEFRTRPHPTLRTAISIPAALDHIGQGRRDDHFGGDAI